VVDVTLDIPRFDVMIKKDCRSLNLLLFPISCDFFDSLGVEAEHIFGSSRFQSKKKKDQIVPCIKKKTKNNNKQKNLTRKKPLLPPS
jgi:hypothetical protein